MRSRVLCTAGVLLLVLSGRGHAEWQVHPETVTLVSPEANRQLLVSEITAAGRPVDRSRDVQYRLKQPELARISDDGLVRPLAEGETQIVVDADGETLNIPLTVTGLRDPRPVSFPDDVIPILTKAGCNSGSCHGKAEGKNGFKLSVFGFDPQGDYETLLMEGRGRRINVAAPEASLMLQKATASIPHGGGRRIEKGSLRYKRVLRWIREGACFEAGEPAPVKRIEVAPEQRVIFAGGRQQLQVTAIDAEGRRRGVTREAEFKSNEPTIAQVDEDGLVRASEIPGEAAILVRYMGHVAVCRITLPQPNVTFQRPPENNFVDRLVWDKLQRLGIRPSGLADDGTFLRRVYLDTIGTLPTAAEAREFLNNSAPNKRARLIDRLLDRPEYADFWAMLWSDILRVDRGAIGAEGAVAMTRWLRQQFRENRPYDEFVRAILTARGNTHSQGPAALYQVLNKPDELSRSISQLFLGVRIECAECHHHPFEKWSQADYYGLAGFFTGIRRKKLPGGDRAVVPGTGSDLKNPRTGEVIPARGLGAEPADFSGIRDRRLALADWVTDPQNPFFARVIANRLWAHYFGRGLVEPIDDLRATNPATNEALLDALADHMREVDYDVKAFTRTLLNSRVYQLSSRANASNAEDRQNFSHALSKTLPAEVLLDAICQVTGVPAKFNGWPRGFRAIRLWDNRMPSYFFRIFGRPVRSSVCQCERSESPSISQALHLMNSPEISAKITHHDGRARQLAESDRAPQEVIEELYLATLSRFPKKREAALARRAFAEAGDRRTAVEDILWALLNSKKFLYNQ